MCRARLQTCLEEHGGRRRREVKGLEEMLLLVILRCIALDHDSLGCPLLTNEQYCFLLSCNYIDQERSAHIVHIGYQDGGILGHLVKRVAVLLHSGGPVYPLATLFHNILKDGLSRLHWR